MGINRRRVVLYLRSPQVTRRPKWSRRYGHLSPIVHRDAVRDYAEFPASGRARSESWRPRAPTAPIGGAPSRGPSPGATGEWCIENPPVWANWRHALRAARHDRTDDYPQYRSAFRRPHEAPASCKFEYNPPVHLVAVPWHPPLIWLMHAVASLFPCSVAEFAPLRLCPPRTSFNADSRAGQNRLIAETLSISKFRFAVVHSDSH